MIAAGFGWKWMSKGMGYWKVIVIGVILSVCMRPPPWPYFGFLVTGCASQGGVAKYQVQRQSIA